MEEVLGKNLYVMGWALDGVRQPEDMANILSGAVKLLGMNTNGIKPTIHQYPLNGKGGVGNTVYLPFSENVFNIGWLGRLRIYLAKLILGRQSFASLILQPLTESFIVSDDYPELDRTYIILASCVRPNDIYAVSSYLSKEVGAILGMGRIKL